MKAKNTTLSEQFQIPNRKIAVRGKIYTPNTHIQNSSLSWLNKAKCHQYLFKK